MVRQAHHERILIIPFTLSRSKGALNKAATLYFGTLAVGIRGRHFACALTTLYEVGMTRYPAGTLEFVSAFGVIR